MDDVFAADGGGGDANQVAWDSYFQQIKPAENAHEHIKEHEGWTLIHDGRRLGDALKAAEGEMRSDLLWGNLGLPMNKCYEKLERCAELRAIPAEERTEEHTEEEEECRRECRSVLELSVAQLEEMQEKKGEFGNEYRVVTAAWYMMMLPDTGLDTPLMAPDDASKAAWEFQQREYERRRVEGAMWRKRREAETHFDEEQALLHPYELTQTKRRHEIEITIPVPAGTKPRDVHAKVSDDAIWVHIGTHPLQPVIHGRFYRKIDAPDVSTA